MKITKIGPKGVNTGAYYYPQNLSENLIVNNHLRVPNYKAMTKERLFKRLTEHLFWWCTSVLPKTRSGRILTITADDYGRIFKTPAGLCLPYSVLLSEKAFNFCQDRSWSEIIEKLNMSSIHAGLITAFERITNEEPVDRWSHECRRIGVKYDVPNSRNIVINTVNAIEGDIGNPHSSVELSSLWSDSIGKQAIGGRTVSPIHDVDTMSSQEVFDSCAKHLAFFNSQYLVHLSAGEPTNISTNSKGRLNYSPAGLFIPQELGRLYMQDMQQHTYSFILKKYRLSENHKALINDLNYLHHAVRPELWYERLVGIASFNILKQDNLKELQDALTYIKPRYSYDM